MTTTAIIVYIATWAMWLCVLVYAFYEYRRLSRELKAAREEAEDYRQALALKCTLDRITAAPGFGPVYDFGTAIRAVAMEKAMEDGIRAIQRVTYYANKL